MSEVKVNKISPRSGTEVTLGDSGDTFTIPSGATINNQGTATNFGATGSASWNTTVKTGDFTAVAGEGYFVNTTSGEIDVTLPAGTAGAVVAIKDYAKTFDTNNCVIITNGSEKIGGSTENGVLSTEGIAVTLIYIDSTQGWLITDDGLQSSIVTSPYIIATGGTISCSGNFRIHTFTGPGTFQVTKAAAAAADNIVSYLVVAGGGGGTGYDNPGPHNAGAGAGAGGFREGKNAPVDSYTTSPLNAPAGIPVSVQSYTISVGAGGAGTANTGAQNSGSVSTFSTITSAGGGAGGVSGGAGVAGGSGGGGSRDGGAAGAGNTPPTPVSQGANGGLGVGGPYGGAGGGGGAVAVGGNGSTGNSQPTEVGGNGGAGAATSITGSSVTRAGGGGAAAYGNNATSGTGGPGGGGNGGSIQPSNVVGVAGTTNTGSGGGGGGNPGGNGGSGVVIIRYRFQ